MPWLVALIFTALTLDPQHLLAEGDVRPDSSALSASADGTVPVATPSRSNPWSTENFIDGDRSKVKSFVESLLPADLPRQPSNE